MSLALSPAQTAGSLRTASSCAAHRQASRAFAIPRRASIVVGSALALALAACGGGTDEAATTGAEATRATRSATLIEPASGWLQVPVLPDPMLDGLQPTANAHVQGMWSPVLDWPINSIHMVMLPNGKVLTYGTRAYDNDSGTGNQDGGTNVLWDPAGGAGAFTISQFATDPKRQLNSFCSSAALLPNGNLLSTGGFGGPYVENDRTSNSSLFTGEYNPSTNLTRDTGLRTADERWYSTMLTMPDGRLIVLGGMLPYAEASWPNTSTTNGLASMTPEVYTPGVGWSLLPGAYSTLAFGQYLTRSEFPHAWVAPNGEIFGISSDQMWFLDPKANGGQGSIRMAGVFKGEARGLRAGETRANLPNVGSSTSSAVLFAPGKALQVGGNGYWVVHDLPASSAATVVDFNNGQVRLTETQPMAFARRFFNATVLPDGQVFVNAGTGFGNGTGEAVYAGEIWNPTTGRWSTMASAQRARMYHNTAGLLLNGTVLTAGGGNPAPVFNRNAEIFYPPYLFRQVNGVTQLAPRPTITGVSSFKVAHGGSLQMLLGTSGEIREVALMGLGTATHGFNPSQRRAPLTFVQSGGRLAVDFPDANLAPPGYYMVFLVDAQGVPSKGVIVAVGSDVAEPPVAKESLKPVTVSTPINAPAIGAGGTARFEARLSQAEAEVSWNFGDGTPPTAFGPNVPVQHVYANPGVYTVVVNMKGLDGVVSTYSFLQAVTSGNTSNAGTTFSSSMAIETRANGDHQIWVANPDHNQVSALSSLNGSRRLLFTGEQPESVAVSRAGVVGVVNKLASTVSLINPQTMALVRTVQLPRASRPHGLVFSPDGATGYVALESYGAVARFTTASGVLGTQIPVGGRIRHLSLSGDGRTLAVSRYITPPVAGEGTTQVSTAGGGEVAIVDTTTSSVVRTVVLAQSQLPDTEIAGRGLPNYLGPLVMSPDGRTGLVPSKQDNIARGTARDGNALNFQNTVRAITSQVNLTQWTERLDQRVDHDNSSVASAAVFHPNGLYAFIALETSREVAALDVTNGLQLFRVDVGFAPQAVQVSPNGRTLYVYNFMGRTVQAIDLTDLIDRGQRRASVAATWQTVTAVAANEAGKRLFYDARDRRLAADAYMSCASCHNDGDTDGRTWDFTHLGEGLRNTPVLRGRMGTAFGRMHWTGNFNEVQDFESQIRGLAGGTGLMSNAQYLSGTVAQPLGQAKAGRSADLDALAAYVNSLTRRDNSPHRLPSGGQTTAGQAGYTLFINRGCTSCHGVGTFTNSTTGRLENVGTIKPSSGGRLGAALTGLDTPSLLGLWSSAPYLHDGSAPTIEAAVRAHTTLNRTWTATEMNNLVAYLREIE